jgi:hypothetical protein
MGNVGATLVVALKWAGTRPAPTQLLNYQRPILTILKLKVNLAAMENGRHNQTK